MKRRPTNINLWSPEEVAEYLRYQEYPHAAEKVDASVRLHSFDEVDGPRIVRDEEPGLVKLGIPADDAARLMNDLSGMRGAVDFGRGHAEGIPPGRVAAALWGIFIADALSSPAHWCFLICVFGLTCMC